MPDTPTTTATAPAPTTPSATPAPAAAPTADKGRESFPQIRQTPIPKTIMDAFRKKARPSGTEMSNKPVDTPKPQEPSETPQPDPEAETEEGRTPETPPETEAKGEPTTPATPAPEPGKGKKVSPWKLVDQYKAKVADLEKQIASVKTTEPPAPGEPPKEFTEKLTKAEARVKELEEEIRFTHYQKSEEFQTKYQKPYEAAWAKAIKELSEVTVTDSNGNTRPATAEDMLALVNLPLGKAREISDSMFGAFSNDAMNHRRAIKELFDAQQDAVKDARSKSEEWEKNRNESMTKAMAEIDRSVGEIWAKANQDAATDTKYGTYFTPRENDPEWNQRLAKGFELVDKAFSDANPRDHRLTPDQRKSVVERHAAVRNRAAAFGPLRYENEILHKRLAELEKELGQYKQSEPPQGGGTRPAPKGGAQPEDPWARVQSGLRKYAR